MKTKQAKFMMVLLILIICLIVLAPTALASEVRSGEIPVTISLGDSPPAIEEDYKIMLKADNIAYPMPEGSVDGLFSMDIIGADTTKLPEIGFSSLGIYTYTISQEAGTNELATYDDSKYNLIVYVTNAEDGSGLETAVLLYMIGETEKLEGVVFHNDYDTIIIEDEEVPIGEAKIPQTGGIPPELFFLAGATIVTAGIVIKRKGE